MPQQSRRTFMNSTALVSASYLSGCASSPKKGWEPTISKSVMGSNDDIRMAIVGLGKKGKQNLQKFSSIPGVHVVALCDPDTAQIAKNAANFNPDYTYKTYTDVRHVIDNPDIDAISITTSNHWHCLISIWACQAGKDVNVEKPVSHTIWEGRQLVKAKDKYGRIVQSGTQNLSLIHI